MGKASKTRFDTTRQARVAAQRAAAKRAEQRRRLLIAVGSVVAVVAVVVTFVLVKANSGPGTAAASSEGPTGAALTSVVSNVTTVSSTALDSVGGGSVDSSDVGAGSSGNSSYLTPVSGTALASGGKPEVLYIGAEWCPFCAAERWAMIVALSRFGTFSGLSTIHSSSTDTDPNTPTFTFYGSTYRSKYVSFVPVEIEKNYRIGNSNSQNVGYVPLQTPTSAQNALLEKYDPGQPGQGGGPIPFIDIGNKYVQVGDLAGYDPTVIDGLSWSQIGADLSNPSSPVAKAIDGSANYLTAAICKLTGNQPASACTPAVKALEAKL